MELEGRELGNYRILSLIGYGATGYVYLAEDPRIQQRVAIKVIQIDPGGDLTQFRDEARLVAQLKHPRIVHLNAYDEDTVDSVPIIYLVTPYYKDGSLAKWLKQRGTSQLSLDDVKYLIGQAADALQYAHGFQIIHSDIKPSNFLIDTEGIANPNRPNLLLSDFGVARFTASSPTRAGMSYPGGLTYMAPEQFNGQTTAASDQYSLAIVAYELLAGHPPFQGTPQVVIRQHLETPPDPPSSANAAVPRSVDTVILRALAKKPEDRFGSVEAFSNALQRRSEGFEQPRRPQHTPPDSPPPESAAAPPVDQPAMPGAARRESPNARPPDFQPRTPNPSPNLPKGRDIYATLVVSPAEAQEGTVRQLILGRRSVPVRVPPNAQNGLVILINGLGEPSPAGGLPGTLHVTVTIAQYQAPPPPPVHMPPPPPPPESAYQAPPPPPASAYQNPPGQMMMPPQARRNSNLVLWIVLAVIILIIAFSICAFAVAYYG